MAACNIIFEAKIHVTFDWKLQLSMYTLRFFSYYAQMLVEEVKYFVVDVLNMQTFMLGNEIYDSSKEWEITVRENSNQQLIPSKEAQSSAA